MTSLHVFITLFFDLIFKFFIFFNFHVEHILKILKFTLFFLNFLLGIPKVCDSCVVKFFEANLSFIFQNLHGITLQSNRLFCCF